MSLASDSYPTTHSPRSARAPRNLSAPWSHFVRGEPSAASASAASTPPSAAVTVPPSEASGRSLEQPAAPSAASRPPPSGSPDNWIDGNAAAAAPGKKSVWERPSGSSIEACPVMGAASWPALTESTRAAPKSSPSDSLKTLSDGSVSAPPGPVIASPPPKASMNNLNPNPTPDHLAPARQKGMKRSDEGVGTSSISGVPANGGPPPPPPLLASMEQDSPEPSPKDLPSKGSNNWDSGARGSGYSPQFHGRGDHHRGYGGTRSVGGGGSHYGRFGNRGRGNYDWNPPRSYGGREHRGHPRPFFRPPPVSTPAPFIIRPPMVRPFVNPMGFPDIPSQVYYVHPPPESIGGMPFVAHPGPHTIPPTMFFATVDHQRDMLVKQIDYYFSSENLCKDIYLRKNMDDQGWVPISLIAGFNKVKQLTNNIQYILDAVQSSTIVEVQGQKIRRRNDWTNWILPPQSLGRDGGGAAATPNDDGTSAEWETEGDTNNNGTRVLAPK